MGGWGPRNPFAERIKKPVQNIGPPLTDDIQSTIEMHIHACNVYIGYRQPKLLIHMKDMVLARERTAILEAAYSMECLPACQKSSFKIRHHLRW